MIACFLGISESKRVRRCYIAVLLCQNTLVIYLANRKRTFITRNWLRCQLINGQKVKDQGQQRKLFNVRFFARNAWNKQLSVGDSTPYG